MSTRVTRGITAWRICSVELVPKRRLRRKKLRRREPSESERRSLASNNTGDSKEEEGDHRMRTKRAVAVAGIGLLLSAGPVLAHHSFAAEFDAERPVKLRGTITRMEWINPHAWVHIELEGVDGKGVHWVIEAGSPKP